MQCERCVSAIAIALQRRRLAARREIENNASDASQHCAVLKPPSPPCPESLIVRCLNRLEFPGQILPPSKDMIFRRRAFSPRIARSEMPHILLKVTKRVSLFSRKRYLGGRRGGSYPDVEITNLPTRPPDHARLRGLGSFRPELDESPTRAGHCPPAFAGRPWRLP